MELSRVRRAGLRQPRHPFAACWSSHPVFTKLGEGQTSVTATTLTTALLRPRSTSSRSSCRHSNRRRPRFGRGIRGAHAAEAAPTPHRQPGDAARLGSSPGFGDEEGCAARLRATRVFARAACTRAKSLAAIPFGRKHDAESDDIEPVHDVVAYGAIQRRRPRVRRGPSAAGRARTSSGT